MSSIAASSAEVFASEDSARMHSYVGLLAQQYRERGRVRIAQPIDDAFATRVQHRLASWTQWALVTRIQGVHRAFDAAAMDAIAAPQRSALDELIAQEARDGFQYLYERYPLYAHGRAGLLQDQVMREAFGLLGSDAFLGLARHITGEQRITHADGQFTRYRRGHFLTLHDDHADGQARVAAFVLQLTPHWAADYGGQLQFVGTDGRVEETVTPGFNSMTLFAVPSPHLVSAVAPFVSASRYALTGWFLAG